MSGIVLSASVRQNLLSLQSTADLLATTQNRLSTGKSVNSALDNPTNFFTAQSLDNRASDINNLLDGIGNGVQVLQAANTGLTSLQKLIDSAKSIANQALQTTVGYSTKSNVSTTISGATAADLRGTTSFASATATSNVLYDGAAGGATAATRRHDARRAAGRGHGYHGDRRRRLDRLVGRDHAARHHAPPASWPRRPGRRRHADRQRQDHHLPRRQLLRPRPLFRPARASAATSSPTAAATPPSISAPDTLDAATVGDVLTAIDLASGVKTVDDHRGAATHRCSLRCRRRRRSTPAVSLTLKSSTGADLSVTGKADFLKELGLTTATGGGNATVTATRTTSASSLGIAAPGRFDPERRWPRHHLQERADPGLDRRSGGSERLRCQRQRR